MGHLEHTSALLALRAELEHWETTACGDPLTANHRGALGRYLDRLRKLAARYADRHDGVLLAALALGPRSGALPGAGDLGSLLEAASGTDADAVDLAIAWGCGWHRTVTPGHEWHGRWVAALLSLAWLVHGSVNRTMRWLEAEVLGVREVMWGPGARDREERLRSYAQHLAMELAFGACRCGHGARDAHGPCGRPDHELMTWRPDVCQLPAFVATAVRGSPLTPPRTGAFAVSMLAEQLCQDHVVRVDVAEFHVCHVCNADAARTAATSGRLDLGGVSSGLHDLGRCPACGALPLLRRTYRAARKNWLVVPAEWGGRHDHVQRHRCGRCGNLFAVNHDHCPLCRHRVPPRHRLTSVWMRRVGPDARRPNPGSEPRRA
jgi:hypothetical protein